MKKFLCFIILLLVLSSLTYIYKDKLFNKYESDPIEIKDEIAPTIVGKDTSILVNTELDFDSIYKCNDNIDKYIKCNIKTDFDNKKPGTYNVVVSAKDEAKNKTEKTFKIVVYELNELYYYIEIIRNENLVIVYNLDETGKYNTINQVFNCSVGKDNKTPLGTFTTSKGFRWGSLVGGHYAQYSTRIINGILFHSVPYLKKDASTLDWEEFNKLGTPASLGCIRMTVHDVKWIFDNIPENTVVYIHDGSIPEGINKPDLIKIDENSNYLGWDPTDPSELNPYSNN